MADVPRNGFLRVWWIPQVPMKAFHVEVDSLREARKMLTVLAEYDKFQYENKVKPDYCNTGGVQVFDAEQVSTDESEFECDGWVDYADPEGTEFDELSDERLSVLDQMAREAKRFWA